MQEVKDKNWPLPDQLKENKIASLGDERELRMLDELNGWCEITDRALTMQIKPEIEQWIKTGSGIKVMWKASPFLIGDWVNIGKGAFGHDWTQGTELFNQYDAHTIANYASVCNRVPPGIRNPDLSFSHHAAVAKLPIREQKKWLEYAALDPDEGRMLTAEELREKIKQATGSEKDEPSLFDQVKADIKSIRNKLDNSLELTHGLNGWEDIIDGLKAVEAALSDLLEIMEVD